MTIATQPRKRRAFRFAAATTQDKEQATGTHDAGTSPADAAQSTPAAQEKTHRARRQRLSLAGAVAMLAAGTSTVAAIASAAPASASTSSVASPTCHEQENGTLYCTDTFTQSTVVNGAILDITGPIDMTLVGAPGGNGYQGGTGGQGAQLTTTFDIPSSWDSFASLDIVIGGAGGNGSSNDGGAGGSNGGAPGGVALDGGGGGGGGATTVSAFDSLSVNGTPGWEAFAGGGGGGGGGGSSSSWGNGWTGYGDQNMGGAAGQPGGGFQLTSTGVATMGVTSGLGPSYCGGDTGSATSGGAGGDCQQAPAICYCSTLGTPGSPGAGGTGASTPTLTEAELYQAAQYGQDPSVGAYGAGGGGGGAYGGGGGAIPLNTLVQYYDQYDLGPVVPSGGGGGGASSPSTASGSAGLTEGATTPSVTLGWTVPSPTTTVGLSSPTTGRVLSVTATATVALPPALTANYTWNQLNPTGTVQFYLGSAPWGAPVAVGNFGTGTGTATTTLSSLPGGPLEISAFYIPSGSPLLVSSWSAPADITILPTASFSVSASATNLLPSQSLTLAAALPSGSAGDVVFTDSAIGGNQVLGTANDVVGVATLTVPASSLADGANPVTAVWSGDGSVASSWATNTVQVTKDASWAFGKTGSPGNQVLEVNGSNGGVDIWQELTNSSGAVSNEQWVFVPVSGNYGQLVNVNSGQCLEVNGTNGNVDTWACVAGANNELWQQVPNATGGQALQVMFSGQYLGLNPGDASSGNGAALAMQSTQSALTSWDAMPQS